MPSFINLILVARRCLTVLLFATLLAPGIAAAQSACTAMWGVVTTAGAEPYRLGYFNNSAGTASKFTTLSFTLTGNANALAGDPSTGLLYYFDRTGANLYSVNLNTQATATIGTITPASPNGNANILGAYIDSSSNLIVMSSGGGNYQLATVSKTGNTTNAVWRTVTYAIGGGIVSSGGSGDIFLDQGGQPYLITNTAPDGAVYPLTLSITAGTPNGTITSLTAGASVTFAASPANIAGASINPATGVSYFGGTTGSQILYSFTPSTANSQVLVDATATAYTITDLGNCVLAPAKPTVSKSFSPTYAALTGSTTTLSINIGNSNTAPIWLNSTFTDQLPPGMTVAAPPALSTGACAASTTVTNVITATAGQSTLTFATGGRIPAGGCTLSFSVTGAAQDNAYTNTIAIGSLTTTAGSNAAAATATYKVGTDFSVSKTEGTGTSGPYTAGPLTAPGGSTIQYILTVTNSASGGTGSASFTDTLPTLITPVLSITAAVVGGGAGTCVTATAVVGGATQITGTLTNVIAGAVCTITVTAKVSAAVAVASAVTNTFSLAPVSGTSDTNLTNNTASVATTVGASANITISKTNGTTALSAGGTTSYTVTIANLGPADAAGSVFTDPVAAGLSCTAVTCTATAANICPAAPTISALQTTGLSLSPTFPAGSIANFVITCGVTATGQ